MVLLVGAAALTGCSATATAVPADRSAAPADKATPAAVTEPSATASQRTPPHASGSPAAALATLAVKGRAPTTGYSRAEFGAAWADVNRNGCDTRNDVLRRDLTAVRLAAGTNGCQVAAGTLADPYSGTRIAFLRGASTSSEVQIDHVVALSNAWQTGALTLPADQREALANDPLNLLAVDGRLNEQKSDGDAATWLPPNRAVRCAYVARQVAVKARYRLWVTPPEKDAIIRVLAGCPGQPLPRVDDTDTASTTSPEPSTPSTADTAAPAPLTVAPEPALPNPTVSYRNCGAVRAAEKAPLAKGQPGYRSRLDADDDGVACQ